MSSDLGWVILAAAATAVDGLLAGASLDQSIKQLPARRRIGMRAFSAYSRASDQASGLYWYALLGIGGTGLTVSAALWGLTIGLPSPVLVAALVAGVLAESACWPTPTTASRPTLATASCGTCR